MFSKLLLVLTVIALVASAGTVPVGGHYRITLFEPAVVQGTTLQAGDYKLDLKDTKVTISGQNAKVPLEVTVKVETTDKKFENTSVRLDTTNGKAKVAEIRLGGTKTKLIFD